MFLLMKKLYFLLFFIFFNSSFSYANLNEKITLEEIENIFFDGYEKFSIDKWQNGVPKKWAEKWANIKLNNERNDEDYELSRKLRERYEKRPQIKGIAKCLYKEKFMSTSNITDFDKQCIAKVIRATFLRSEQGEKKRPGDIFYALRAVAFLTTHWSEQKKFAEYFVFEEGDKPRKGMLCNHKIIYLEYSGTSIMGCAIFKNSTYKKIEKFKKDPTNEKVLGHKLIKFIKHIRMVDTIKKKIGTDNFELMGDMLNNSVAAVHKNNLSPDLKKRRFLLKKYSLNLKKIKKKLDEENYKSLDKDVLRLFKIYQNLNALKTTQNEIAINVDEAVKIISETNKLVQNTTLKAKNNEKEKLLSLASINFMQSLIDSILSIIPEKYYIESKPLDRNLFDDDELDELDTILNIMLKKNREIKSEELTYSMNMINEFIDPFIVLKKLNNLGISSIIKKPLTQNLTAEIAKKELRDNLDKDILKSAKKILQELDKRELDDLTKEATDLAREISSDESVKKSATSSYPDPKFGGQSLKRLIAISRR